MTNGQGSNSGPGEGPGAGPDKWSEWVMPQDAPQNPYQAGPQPQQYQQQYQQPPQFQPQFQQQPQFEQQFQQQPSSDGDSKSSSLPYILLILLLTVLLAGGAIWYLSTQLSSNKDQPTAQQRTNYVSPSTSKQPSTSSSSSSSSSTTTTKKKEHKPQPTGTKCGDMNIATIYAATSVTSCEFAMQVGRVVGMRPEPKDGDRFTVQAHSPVTNQNYSMKCTATGKPVTEIVCTGGNNARVQIVVSAEGR